MEYSDAYNNNYYNQNTDQLSHKVLSDIYPLWMKLHYENDIKW